MKGTILLVLILLFAFFEGYSQKGEQIKISPKDYIIYSVKEGKKVKPKTIIEDLGGFDVLFFGETHNDSIGHQLQNVLFRLMFKELGENIALSMEMFDRDVQYIMDEYLQGIIKQSYFNKDSRKWSNYKDYRPMVEFAKEKELNVICANAPFRYVNVASNKGVETLMKLSENAKKAMAPLPYKMASGKYLDKLHALMGHDPNDTTQAKPSYNMAPGQSLWDATMAYSVFEYFETHPDHKVLHLNGRFHTEERLGIVERLAEFNPDLKPLVITAVPDAEDFPKVNIAEYSHLGDYIIFTNPKVPRSY